MLHFDRKILAVRLLLGQLERLGAVSVTDDVARLEPLGMHAVRYRVWITRTPRPFWR